MFQIQIVTAILIHCVKFGIKKGQKTRKITFYVHFTLCFYICNLRNIKYFYGDYIFSYGLFFTLEIRENLRILCMIILICFSNYGPKRCVMIFFLSHSLICFAEVKSWIPSLMNDS